MSRNPRLLGMCALLLVVARGINRDSAHCFWLADISTLDDKYDGLARYNLLNQLPLLAGGDNAALFLTKGVLRWKTVSILTNAVF